MSEAAARDQRPTDDDADEDDRDDGRVRHATRSRRRVAASGRGRRPVRVRAPPTSEPTGPAAVGGRAATGADRGPRRRRPRRPTVVAGVEMVVEPDRVGGGQRPIQPIRGEASCSLVRALRVVVPQERIVAPTLGHRPLPDRPAAARAAGADGLGLGGRLGRPFGGQRLAQALASAGEQGSRRDVADLEGCRELDAGQVVDLGQEERRPLSFGDLVERALEWAPTGARPSPGARPTARIRAISPVHGMNRTILRRRNSSSATRWAIWYSHARAWVGIGQRTRGCGTP